MSRTPREFCRSFFTGHVLLRPLEGTALGVSRCDVLLEDLSPQGLQAQERFYRDSLACCRALLRGRPEGDDRLDLRKVESLCVFNLHLLRDLPQHASNPEHALELQETISLQVLRAKSKEDWTLLDRRLGGVPEFLRQLEGQIRARLSSGPPLDRRCVQDILDQVPEIVSYLKSFRRKGLSRTEAAAEAYAGFGRLLEDAIPRCRRAFAIGETEYAWRMRHGLEVREPLGRLESYGRRRLKEIRGRMREVARRIDRGADVRRVMARLSRPHPKSDAEALRLYRALSERAKEFVVRKGLFDVPPDYRVDIVPAPPGVGAAITTAAYFPAPPFDRARKGYFLVARGQGDPKRLCAHNPFHAASTAVHEAFPGHDLQYCYWQSRGGRISPVRFLRGDPRNWGESMNAEGYAHYAEELMREHGFFTPEEELFQLGAQAWRAARVVVDIGLHAGGMSLKAAAALMRREAFLPPAVAAGEAFRYSKWPTQAVTYALGKRGIEQLKARRRASSAGRFSEAGFHAWLLSFGPLPPSVIADSSR